MHELKVVDDEQVQAALQVQAAGLSPHLGHRQHRRVVEVDVEIGDDAQGVDYPRLLAVGVHAEAEAGGVHAGLCGQEALHHLLSRHLHREDAHGGLLPRRRVAGEVHGQRGLANGGAGRHHDEVRTLEATQQGVQVHEAGGDGAGLGGDRSGGVVSGGQVALQQLLNVDEVADGLSLADGGDERLGTCEDLSHIRAGVVGHLSDLPGSGDHLAVGGVALD